MPHSTPQMIDNSGITGREDKFETIDVHLDKILKSWKVSLFSFEWLTPEGKIRTPDQLPEKEREKYETVLSNFRAGKDLERPILGIGVLDNVEIGSRRDILLTLYAQGVKTLSVHVSKSIRHEFVPYQ